MYVLITLLHFKIDASRKVNTLTLAAENIITSNGVVINEDLEITQTKCRRTWSLLNEIVLFLAHWTKLK